MNYRLRGIKYPVAGIAALLPAFLIYCIIILYPMFSMVYTSFFEWNGLPTQPLRFVGLSNFLSFFTDYASKDILRNMGILLGMHFVLTVPIAFLLALVINDKFRGVRIVKAVYFIPIVVNRVAIGMMFNFLVYPKIGPITALMEAIGLGNVNLLGNMKTAMFTVAFVEVWQSTGLYMILFLSGLASISTDIYEAAAIDGVTRWQRLWYITLPSLRQMMRIVIVLVLTGAFKVFDIVLVLTGGGPGSATQTPATIMYKSAFLQNRFGYADSVATMTVVVCLLITVLFNYVFHERDRVKGER